MLGLCGELSIPMLDSDVERDRVLPLSLGMGVSRCVCCEMSCPQGGRRVPGVRGRREAEGCRAVPQAGSSVQRKGWVSVSGCWGGDDDPVFI